MANEKLNRVFVNRTNYFSPSSSRTYVRILSDKSYQSRESKIEGYESRLYWQFRYCHANNWPVFFFTLTYNDKALPDFFGQPCFDYEDLRWFLNGSFYKFLHRKYGCSFRYFVGAELGDGNGDRGLHNNPHYHVLLFFEPSPCTVLKKEYEFRKVGVYQRNSKLHKKGEDKVKRYLHKVRVNVPFNPPSDQEFLHLIRYYWQGFDQDQVFVPFEDAKFGIVKEGKYGIRVMDFRACVYCAKYVCKDAKLKAFELDAESLLRDKAKEIYNRSDYENQPLVYEDLINSFVSDGLKEYRNRFCNKCRISHGLGDYALEFIDKTNPYILIPDKDDYKRRPISLYYYRKLYTDVVKDPFNQNLYVLNEDGLNYKVSQLGKRIDTLADKTRCNCELLERDSSLYQRIINSDVNVFVDFSYRTFLNELHKFYDGRDRSEVRTAIFRRFAEYKLVYQDRFFHRQGERGSVFDLPPRIDVLSDYKRFLQPSYYNAPYYYFGASVFLANVPQDWLSYDTHEYFCDYIRLFRVFDLCADYFFIQNDDKKQRKAEEIAENRRFHKKLDFDKFVNSCV